MSAYGAIAAPESKGPLGIRSYPLPVDGLSLVTYPITGADAPEEVIQYLYKVFAEELEGGKTYPQEGPISFEGFTTYFFGSTTIVGVVQSSSEEIKRTLGEALVGKVLEDALGGCYYIKPNYPGRSSHNGGFLVPPTQRGRKIGLNLGRSYLQYAPELGYRGSVFNLVYKNNGASLAIWDQLGFQRVGEVPNAGRLKTGPNGTEEYVDAVVVFKSFV
ncbi:uncharacterized protein I303_104665 [Kwoniella dejecticola CBS 10117]|uniref:N-acetyltransferase domain-containing protein n=1 Tax=Kwoniella dejecticola CBS 10117 TaxID=1296121 RepID=A0A1A6A4P7_9TREE|nr:uncharacterized protein I303_04354 [Kwoniella dejecticola CBS 10117]OBR85027.1 hypothetical protein I303_04354 [Kwoniella dejecticola CBS 10117]